MRCPAHTIDESDFFVPFIIGYGLRPSRCGPGAASQGGDKEIPVPAHEVYVHAEGLKTTRGGEGPCDVGPAPVAFCLPRRHRHPGLHCFRRSIPRLYAPLSTLRGRPCATTARGGCHVTINSWQPCCTRDEGRPLGLGLQDQGPNHRKLPRSNGRGGERCGKRREQSRQVCAGQTNVSEPLLTCRKRRDVAKTRLPLLACDKARRKPADWPSGDRHEDGVRPARGSCAERGNLSPRCQGRPPRGRPLRSRVPMRGAGADGFVVPSKPGNAGGGKGPDTPAEEAGQPAMGGAGV